MTADELRDKIVALAVEAAAENHPAAAGCTAWQVRLTMGRLRSMASQPHIINESVRSGLVKVRRINDLSEVPQ